MKSTQVIITLIVLVLIGAATYFFSDTLLYKSPADDAEPVVVEEVEEVVEEMEEEEVAEPAAVVNKDETVIGTSVEGNDIVAYHFGEGDTEVLLLGGIHGGYSWNTALLGFELVEYLDANRALIPDDVRVTVVPLINPDGLEKVTGKATKFSASDVTGQTVPGRFNANTVDLNRNFDCEWQATGTWQNQDVSGGSAPFSEPETRAVRDFVTELEPAGVVTYYSAAGGVYSSNCNNGVSIETAALTNVYAEAAGYPAYEEFDFYEITGDMVNWMAGQNIPAISVLLSDHESTELSKNLAGVTAVLDYFASDAQ